MLNIYLSESMGLSLLFLTQLFSKNARKNSRKRSALASFFVVAACAYSRSFCEFFGVADVNI